MMASSGAVQAEALRAEALHAEATRAEALRADAVRAEVCKTLRAACAMGCDGAVRALVEHFGVTRDEVIAHLCLELSLTSREAGLRTARWLVGRFGLDGATARRSAVARALDGALDDLDAVRWLVEEFRAAAEGTTLARLCAAASREVLRWLARRLGLTAADARADGNAALLAACRGGRLPAARWLAGYFELDRRDARAGGNAALRAACRGGHLDVARWLVANFGLTADDVRGGEAASAAAASGRRSVVEWLVEEFALTADDFHSWSSNALIQACLQDRVSVVACLDRRFDFDPSTREYVAGVARRAVRDQWRRKKRDLFSWC